MARILIAGCGYVGTALGLALCAEGHTVFGLRRDPGGLPQAIVPLPFDLSSGAPLVLPADVDFAVYCVGAKEHTEAAYRAAYVDGLAVLLAALAAQPEPPRRVLLTSSTSVYAQHAGEWVDEASPARPERFYGRILLEAEAHLAASGLPAVVLRLGGIYGPGRTRLLARVARGESPPAVTPPSMSHTTPHDAPPHYTSPHYTNRIHRDDAAGALRFLMFGMPRGVAPAALYLGCDCEPAARRDVHAFLAAALGAPALPGPDPAPADSRPSGKRCSNARLRAAGYRFQYPSFREGYRELAAAYVTANRAMDGSANGAADGSASGRADISADREGATAPDASRKDAR